MATVKDVAALAGVSTATVSRVLAGMGASSATREAVLAAADQLSFRPNGVARALRSTGTGTVGLVVSDLLNPFFSQLARAAEDEARRSGFSVIIGNADEDPSQQDHYVRILLERQVDGLIVVPTVETSPLLREAAATGRRLVLVDRPAQDVEAPLVSADGSAAIDALVEQLLSSGRRDLAIVAGPEHAGSSNARLTAFRTALQVRGRDLPPTRIVRGDFRPDSGRRAVAALLDGPSRPDAVLVANGEMGVGVIGELQTRGELHVPQDLAVAVYDDLDFFTLLRPTVTAIAQPTERLGHTAMQMLIRQIRGEVVHDEVMPCELVLRESTVGSGDD